jgi:DNA polymerase I-like protein with 3'-5' exonuclease and polymerase domains
VQQPFSFALPQTIWSPPKVSELPSWKDAKRVAIDVECRDEKLKRLGPGCRRDPRSNFVCGFGVAIEDGPEFYVPLKHAGGDNVSDPDAAVAYLRDQIKAYDGVIVNNGINYDLDWISTTVGDESILSKKIMDPQCLAVLVNELHLQYDLDSICERAGLPGKDEAALRQAASAFRVDPKTEMWKLPARYVEAYGRTDARRALQVLRRLEEEAEREGVQQIWELEQKVTPILVKMRRRGVRIDFKKLEQIERRALDIEIEEVSKVERATGVQIGVGNIWKAEVLAHALRAYGVEPGKTATGKSSVDKVLLKDAGDVGKWILRAREWNKLRTTFCSQVREFAIGDRVHCSFNQLKATGEDGEERGVRYGRLSSSNFNMQYQPVRHDEYGNLWRSVYVPDEGAEGWACSDWSQQEPRIGVHYAEILEKQSNGRECPGASAFADEYRKNPALDIHQKLTDLANDPINYPRKVVKNFVNGRLYGMGNVKLCWQMGWPTEWRSIHGTMREVPTRESQAKIDGFLEFAPWIPGLTRAAARAAEKNGFVWTILRRKCHFEKGHDGKIWKAHKAFNRVGQGSAADQMKATLVAADAEGIPVQLAVHDEFDFSYGDLKEAKRLKELQMTVVTFNVPMKVDLEIGDSWGNLTKVKD